MKNSSVTDKKNNAIVCYLDMLSLQNFQGVGGPFDSDLYQNQIKANNVEKILPSSVPVDQSF